MELVFIPINKKYPVIEIIAIYIGILKMGKFFKAIILNSSGSNSGFDKILLENVDNIIRTLK